MKILSLVFRFLYMWFPSLVIFTVAYQLDRWSLLVAILASYFGSLSRIYKYHGLPIFNLGMLLYLIFNGYPVFTIYSFIGMWLFWGYFMAGFAVKCEQILEKEQTINDYQYN